MKGKTQRLILFAVAMLAIAAGAVWLTVGDHRPREVKEREKLEQAFNDLAGDDRLLLDIRADLIEKTPFVLLDEWVWEFYKPFKEPGLWTIEFKPIEDNDGADNIRTIKLFSGSVGSTPTGNGGWVEERFFIDEGIMIAKRFDYIQSLWPAPDRAQLMTHEINFFEDNKLVWVEKESKTPKVWERFDADGNLIERIEKTQTGLMDIRTVRTKFPEQTKNVEEFWLVRVEDGTAAIMFRESDGEGVVFKEAQIEFSFLAKTINLTLYPDERPGQYYWIRLGKDYRPIDLLHHSPGGGLIADTSWEPLSAGDSGQGVFIQWEDSSENASAGTLETQISLTFSDHPPPTQ